MDRAQDFIKKCLFTKNFDDPNKPIAEKRLQETLLLLPTDGGNSSRLKRTKSALKISAHNLQNITEKPQKHSNYRTINKNSKSALKEYIVKCQKNTKKAHSIAHEQSLTTRDSLNDYIQEKEPQLWVSLIQYDKFLPMYENLWQGYIREVLDIPLEVPDPSKLKINTSSALMKLSMADCNGAVLKVVKCINHNMIGIEGIVIWDSQKNFIMVTKGRLVDAIKIIPKKGSIFDLEIPLNEEDALLYTIVGDRFQYRSSDRAGRKFKSRRCDDLAFYIREK